MCSASNCRTAFKEKQVESFLHWEDWKFPNTEESKTKAPILNLSEFKCVPYLKMKLGGEAALQKSLD